MEYEAVIGLEVHVQLETNSKAFCGCSTEFGKEPNSQVCPVCLGFPGSLPVLNRVALEYAIKVGLALNCKAAAYTKFDRKNYFYPDLPKDYQISQYDLPLAERGFLDIDSEGKSKRVGICRVHLEEDAGKLIHRADVSLVDFNRAGIPLLEIVSDPEIFSPQEAYDYLVKLKSIVEYLEVSDCDMEKGSLRCDANISLRKKGDSVLGVKAELKNMNSFKAVKEALDFEIIRQKELLGSGKPVIQETRLWDERQAKTLTMRTKEEAKDYRYFPEPDLAPFLVSDEELSRIKEGIPELPQEKKARFIREYGLSDYDAKIMVFSKKGAEYAEGCIKAYPPKDKKPLVNWLIGPLSFEANARNCNIAELKLPEAALIELLGFLERNEISSLSAKSVLTEMIETKKPAQEIIKNKGLAQISDADSLAGIIEEAIRENPGPVQDYKGGKASALMFLVGQVMKKTKSRANPKVAQEMLKGRLTDV